MEKGEILQTAKEEEVQLEVETLTGWWMGRKLSRCGNSRWKDSCRCVTVSLAGPIWTAFAISSILAPSEMWGKSPSTAVLETPPRQGTCFRGC